MKRSITRLVPRAAAAALFTLLAGCDGDGVTTPRTFAGHWLAVESYGTPPTHRIEDRLELRHDGKYEWTTITFGPGGRASDGMVVWLRMVGDWGVDGELLALRTSSGSQWQNSASGGVWTILDFSGEWDRRHRVSREGNGRLVVEEYGPGLPIAGVAPPRRYDFERVPNFDDAPEPDSD
ncbi:MAG TPA: hypothetical protein VFR37_22230 [Longimicrobium sp.]|nr:hypothetical protein [Longimicrobium sp.]